MGSETRAKISLANKGKSKPEGFGFRVAASQAFFTPEEIGEVRMLAEGGLSRRAIARLYGTSHNVVSKALYGKGAYYSAV